MSKTLSKRNRKSVTRSPLRGLFPRGWVDDLFEQYLTGDNAGEFPEMMRASMDVAETDRAFEVKMDLPGVNADEVDINIDKNTLTVRGERLDETEEKDEDRQYHRVERYSGSFARSVVLPNSINEDEAVAEFKDGVLKIVIPKTEDAKPRKIRITS